MKNRTIQTNEIRDFLFFVNHKMTLNRKQQNKRNELLLNNYASKTTSSIIEPKHSQQDIWETPAKQHDVEYVARFLHSFTEKGYSTLRFTTHLWEKNKETQEYSFSSFDEFKNAYKEVLDNLGFYKLYDKSNHLWKMINNFLVIDDPQNGSIYYTWSKYKLKIGYNKYLREWMETHPGEQPFAMDLNCLAKEYQPKEKVNGKVLGTFNNVVEVFKHCIEFRDNDLYYMLDRRFKNSDFKIDKDKLLAIKGMSFFTDTELVDNALEIIAGNIFQRSQFPELSISCSYVKGEERDAHIIQILQKDSFSCKDISNQKINPNGNEGSLHDICDVLKNIADFSVESVFKIDGEEKTLRINYLASDNSKNTKAFENISKDDCLGFKYILTFYTYHETSNNN